MVSGVDLVCYDVYVEHKPENRALLEALSRTPKLSLLHGVSIIEPIGAGPPLRRGPSRTTAYLFSEREREGYRHNYGLSDDALRVVGVPRHSSGWMRSVVEVSAARHAVPDEPFVLVISRPSSGADVTRGYLPLARKRAALEELRQVVADELGLPVIVKLHPKEREQGLFEEVFGLDEYGEGWSFSRAHPMHLAQHATLAMTFYSGVAVDLVACGVPVIERLDLRGLAGWDLPSAHRDSRGAPALAYRRHGLVLAADDLDDLREHVRSVARDRSAAIERLQAAYREVFPDPETAIGRITADVLTAFGRRG